ncbi:MAG: NAD(P)H-dependent oxidoreductase [Oscillospiraceae bacterium]|nr:NAD(P)H-dependent oxidoreductase [Oscillospiraceae bacterium]
MKKVLMIVGSLRKNSFNHQLAKQVEAMLAGKVEVSYLHYADMPFMNQDMEFPAPESVARVRKAVLEADGIWIFSPEYNYQIPGVLKNLMDWLSRPLAPNDWERGSAVKGKHVTISGVAGKSAAAGVRKHLSALLEVMSMKVTGGMGSGIPLDAEAFQSGALNLSEENLAEIRGQAEAFLDAI